MRTGLLPRPLLVRVQPPQPFCGSSSAVEPHVANVDVASSNLVSRSILRAPHIYYVSIDKFIETATEMIIMAAVMFLTAFFCFRVILLPKAIETPIDKVYEVEEELHQER